MAQPSRPGSVGHLKDFQKRSDGVYRIPGGALPSITICLREQGTKIEVRDIEPGHVFYDPWVSGGRKRVHFPFDPPKAYRFHSRMRSAERQLAVSIQRYVLKVYVNEDISTWCYPPRREGQGVTPTSIPCASSTTV